MDTAGAAPRHRRGDAAHRSSAHHRAFRKDPLRKAFAFVKGALGRFTTARTALATLVALMLLGAGQEVLRPHAWAGELPQAPILRIEPGMHTAMIRRIGVDAENRHLVTGSDDKTVRVWELATGRLLRVLRPPIGEGNEGRIYAVAISPDGRTVVCGGWTGYDWDNASSIYLFDRKSGRLTRRISGVGNVISHLAYSKDGRFLVATLGGKKGIRVYSTSDFTLAAEDRAYGGDSYGADFDRTGRLATTSFDGFIRLYDHNFRRIAKAKAPGGAEPFSVSFSPDGESIAVGFYDSTKVDVLSGADLSYRFSPDTSRVNNGHLSVVAWSADGLALYAGGGYIVGATTPIRKWVAGGRGPFTDLTTASSTIIHIMPLNTGGVVFGAGDPAFGMLDAGDQRTLFQGPPIADFRAIDARFLVSPDGTTVQFRYEVFGRSPARFSVTSRLLAVDPAADSSLAPPQTTASGLTITDWKDTTSPKLNGRALPLQQYERSFRLAIAPDGSRFLLGTSWSLRLFDRQGAEQWRIPVPETTWGVNIAGNGKLAVAAFGDGTIRWYRLQDGQELLALYPHPDKKRWVLWTPSGYREVVARVLLDAKKDDILDGLEWIQRETTSKDAAMIFFAGHGVNDRSGNYYFLPVNANTNRLKPTGVIFADILTTVRDLAGKTLVFLDTCRSGNIMGPRRGVADINAVVNELVGAQNGAVVFAASTGRQDSQEKPEWGNGAFTKALVEGLTGQADLMRTGKITVNLLDAYVAERVKKLTNGTQTPTTSKPETVPDFPVALRQ